MFPHELPSRIRKDIATQADANKDGYVCKQDLKQLLKNLNGELPGYAIMNLIEMGDNEGKGKISVENFKKLVLGRI